MKNYIRILILTICLIIASVPVFGAESLGAENGFGLYDPKVANSIPVKNEITVQLNGNFIDFMDSEGNKVEPQIINSRTMVPMRKIFEVLGAEVQWQGETKSIIAKTDELEINLQIGSNEASVVNKDGNINKITLDSAPVIIENRTMVPVRFIAESLNKTVGWDNENRAVIIIDTSIIAERIKSDAPNFYEYLTADYAEISTETSKSDIHGKIKYEDKENKKNNSSLNLSGKAETLVSEGLMQISLNLKVTGKGIIMDTVKEEDLEKITADIILDFEKGYIYVSSNKLTGELEDKYLRYDMEETKKEFFKSLLSQESKMKNIETLLVKEDSLTVDSYNQMLDKLNLISSIMNDDKFTSYGRTTKTYEYKITLEDLANIFEIKSEDENEQIDFSIEYMVKVSKDIVKETNTTLNFEVEYEDETLTGNIELQNTLEDYNDKVNIKIPKEKDIAFLDI